MSLTKGVMDFNRRIAQMNEICGTNAPPLSDRDFRPATNISDKTTDCVSRFLRVTGQEAFLYDVAPGVKALDGMETEHGVFVRNTESKYLPFTLWHEGGHAELRRNPAAARRLRDLYDRLDRNEKLAYAEKQNASARDIYGPNAQAAIDPTTMRDEFIADMFGVYGVWCAQNNGEVEYLLDTVGVTEETFLAFRAVLNEVYSASMIPEADLRDEVDLGGTSFMARGGTFDYSQHPSTRIAYKPLDSYSPYMQNVIQEYLSAVDPRIVDFANDVLAGNNPKPLTLRVTSAEMGADIARILGWNPTGCEILLDTKQVRHTQNDHGLGGYRGHRNSDMSMADVNDLARAQYVIDNYDEIGFGGLTQAYSEPVPGYPGETRTAETVVLSKRVDSTYYVAEAIPDSSTRKVRIVTVFMSDVVRGIEKGNPPLLDTETAPRHTSKNVTANTLTRIIHKDREKEYLKRKSSQFSFRSFEGDGVEDMQQGWVKSYGQAAPAGEVRNVPNVPDLSGVLPCTREESRSLDMLDARNVSRYQKEVTSALNRSFPSWQNILIGKPSGILAEKMESNNPLYMVQTAARKAALTDKKNGGKHGLGRGVLDELPYQLNDPMAITGNTTEHVEKGDNSIVVWTDWMTDAGDSVIVPIRIDIEDGGVEIYNNVNTLFDAHNKDYVADLLREGNVLYTRDEKSIEELLSQRRQVPKSRSFDANNSMHKTGREVKHSTQSSQFSQRSFEDDGVEDMQQAPLSRAQQVLQDALDLFELGVTPDEYFERDPDAFDNMVSKKLRDIYLRNDVPMGGALGDKTLAKVLKNSGEWKQRKSIELSATFPQRQFENLGKWRKETDSPARVANYLEGEQLKKRGCLTGRSVRVSRPA